MHGWIQCVYICLWPDWLWKDLHNGGTYNKFISQYIYTYLYPQGPDYNPGINKRAMTELFDIACDRQEDWQYTLTVSMTEIYNEQVHDLLGSNPEARLDIKQGSCGNFVQGLTWMPVQNTGEINEVCRVHACIHVYVLFKVFAVGHKNRATAATNMNIESSRSHALLCIKVTGKNLTTGAHTLGECITTNFC